MTEFLKNNPMALRHCLLYEFLQGKPIEEAFSDFCEAVGNNAIKKESFEFWFDKFFWGIFDDAIDPINDMRNIFRNDKYALRTCILYESLRNKRIETNFEEGFEHSRNCLWDYKLYDFFWQYETVSNCSYSAYKNFRKAIEEDVMEYREFDFWFHRFLNGNYDLNYEVDKNKKFSELIDMPLDVMENIVEYLDIFDRLSLAKTSRSLRTFTNNQKLFHQTLELTLDRYRSFKIIFDEKHFRSYTDWKEAILGFKNIIKNPKLHLNTVLIDLSCFRGDSFEAEEHSLKLCTHQLHVKKMPFEGNSLESLLNILQCLKPFEQEFGEAVRRRPNTFHHTIPNSNEYFEITLNRKKFEITRKMK